MHTYIAPNRESIIVPDGRVITYGLIARQNELVCACLPAQGYELYEADIPSDLIAIPARVLIISASDLDADGQKMIFDYYTEIGDCSDETVFWIGNPKPLQYGKSVLFGDV